MAAVIHFRDGTEASIASGTDAGPFGYSGSGQLTPEVLEIRNSSARVAIAATEVVKYIEIS